MGGSPNRIGQGIEFDYCCVHASFALRALGIETVMVNCNPETVSTDYDTSDRLYFEPLTFEDVLAICEEEKTSGTLLGVLVQYGGQTPLKLAVALEAAGIPMLGTPADAIDRAIRERPMRCLLTEAASGAMAEDRARRIAAELEFPVLVRRATCSEAERWFGDNDDELDSYMAIALNAARASGTQSILVDRFIKDAIEVDVDAVGGQRVVIGGVMQHVEAGVHSGDSACASSSLSVACTYRFN